VAAYSEDIVILACLVLTKYNSVTDRRMPRRKLIRI